MTDADRIRDLQAKLADIEARLDATKALHRRAEHALASVHHSIRNVLARVRSIAGHTAGYAADLPDFMAHFDGRLAALARFESMLMRSGAGSVDLEEIIREEFLTFTIDHGARISITGDAVQLDQRIGENLALAVHELATNALKFGALSNSDGNVNIHWTVEDERLTLDWIETSAPAPVSAQQSGFGRELIENGLPFQIAADTSLEFTPDGVRCRIECGTHYGPSRRDQ